MINRPEYIHHAHSIYKDRHDDEEQDNSKKRKSKYLGRLWKTEEDDEIGVQPTPATSEKTRPPRETLYTSRQILEKAEKLFAQLTTLEEKIAQLVFCVTESVYDVAKQHELELLIQAWQIGGILFTKGDYKRQCYLIERYQELTKTTLLIGNDFLHGLTFYFEDKLPNVVDHFSDLGKTIMAQNRSAGIHFQLINLRKSQEAPFPLNDKKRLYFRSGIRAAHGISAQEALEFNSPVNSATSTPYQFHALNGAPVATFNERHVQELLGNKTLYFSDLSHLEESDDLKNAILEFFKKQSDIFFFGHMQATKAIQIIYESVRSGRISEKEIDRRVKKLLVLKAAAK